MPSPILVSLVRPAYLASNNDKVVCGTRRSSENFDSRHQDDETAYRKMWALYAAGEAPRKLLAKNRELSY